MRIQFRTSALRKQYEESEKAVKAYGPQVARKFVERINILKVAKTASEVMAQRALRCHPLKGDRKGQHAILLHDRWRLILRFEGGAMEVVTIEEVSKHYDD